MDGRLGPNEERLLKDVYEAELKNPQHLRYYDGPKTQSLGFDQRRDYHNTVRKLEKEGLLRDVTKEESSATNIPHLHLRLTSKGRAFCEDSYFSGKV